MDRFSVIIEIPKGSNLKYEYDETSKEFKLDFVFKDGLVFPFNYGFILNTKGGDGDTLDAIVLSSKVLEQGTEVECKAIGMVEMLDRGEQDDKIICVPVADAFAEKYFDISNLPPEWTEECKKFYIQVAKQKNKVIEIKSFRNKKEASELIKANIRK